MKSTTAGVAVALALALAYAGGDATHIGSRLELFVDEYLIEAFSGGARLVLHRPTAREIVFKTDAPWEGNASGFQSVFREDFRSAEAGTSPTKQDLNPPCKAWTILEGDADRVQVLNDDPVASGKAGGRRYLKVERRDEVQLGGGIAHVKLDPGDAAETENGIVEVEARIYVPSSNKGCVAIDGYDNAPPWGCDRPCFQLRFFPDGSASYYRAAHIPIPGLHIRTDAWQDVLVRARMKEAVFDVTVAGNTVEGIPFAEGDRHRLMTVSLGPIAHEANAEDDSQGSTLYLERVKVKVIP